MPFWDAFPPLWRKMCDEQGSATFAWAHDGVKKNGHVVLEEGGTLITSWQRGTWSIQGDAIVMTFGSSDHFCEVEEQGSAFKVTKRVTLKTRKVAVPATRGWPIQLKSMLRLRGGDTGGSSGSNADKVDRGLKPSRQPSGAAACLQQPAASSGPYSIRDDGLDPRTGLPNPRPKDKKRKKFENPDLDKNWAWDSDECLSSEDEDGVKYEQLWKPNVFKWEHFYDSWKECKKRWRERGEKGETFMGYDCRKELRRKPGV